MYGSVSVSVSIPEVVEEIKDGHSSEEILEMFDLDRPNLVDFLISTPMSDIQQALTSTDSEVLLALLLEEYSIGGLVKMMIRTANENR